ncbi:hypothetical protein GJ744_000104 [Endocarpon pusillum]|uniref:Uncharacterized protein n=1 Tax=Endocarpon pusillum TaxID=364733 RepID=A0A8H7ATY8_9EURO|nr:hypothetical protein GJ744_000104 [Endocarpon pusillum]
MKQTLGITIEQPQIWPQHQKRVSSSDEVRHLDGFDMIYEGVTCAFILDYFSHSQPVISQNLMYYASFNQ